jgi:hypothetical protein
VQWRANRLDQPKAVESRGVPQSVKIQCRLSEAINPQSLHKEQPHVHAVLSGIQAGMSESKAQGQTFSLLIKLCIKVNRMAYVASQKLMATQHKSII